MPQLPLMWEAINEDAELLQVYVDGHIVHIQQHAEDVRFSLVKVAHQLVTYLSQFSEQHFYDSNGQSEIGSFEDFELRLYNHWNHSKLLALMYNDVTCYFTLSNHRIETLIQIISGWQ